MIIYILGYGKITPSTVKGKIFVVVYGIIGIPFFLVALADMSQYGFFLQNIICQLKDAFRRFISSGIKLFMSWICSRKKKLADGDADDSMGLCDTLFKALVVVGAFLLYVAGGALVLPVWEDLNTLDSMYFAFVSLTTIGFGDIGEAVIFWSAFLTQTHLQFRNG